MFWCVLVVADTWPVFLSLDNEFKSARVCDKKEWARSDRYKISHDYVSQLHVHDELMQKSLEIPLS
jgi:hypothetical protein